MRKYTVDEIDAMREALSWRLLNIAGGRTPAERAAEIEDQLRTHIMNGTDPEELKTWS